MYTYIFAFKTNEPARWPEDTQMVDGVQSDQIEQTWFFLMVLL